MTTTRKQGQGLTLRDKITPATVLEMIRRHVGKESALRPGELVEMLTNARTNPGLERHLRAQVRGLRDIGWPICAEPSYGYWWPTGADEMTAVSNWHRKRALSSLRQVSRIKRIGIPVLAGQMALPIPGVSEPSAPGEQPAPGPGALTPGPSPKGGRGEADRALSLIAGEIPSQLDEVLAAWMAEHGWSEDRVVTAAVAMFLMGKPDTGPVPGRCYLDVMFREGGHEGDF